MTLRDVLADPGAPDVEVTDLAYDNRAVQAGTLFVCVPGYTRDGHDFAPDAVARGASALVVERPLPLGVPEVLVDDVRAAMAPAAARLYGDPTAALRTVGITGTNGKTTTAFLVRALLEAGGLRTGPLGSAGTLGGGRARPRAGGGGAGGAGGGPPRPPPPPPAPPPPPPPSRGDPPRRRRGRRH